MKIRIFVFFVVRRLVVSVGQVQLARAVRLKQNSLEKTRLYGLNNLDILQFQAGQRPEAEPGPSTLGNVRNPKQSLVEVNISYVRVNKRYSNCLYFVVISFLLDYIA